MESLRHNDFTFTHVRTNGINVIIHIIGYYVDEYITVKRTMFDGLKKWVEDNY